MEFITLQEAIKKYKNEKPKISQRSDLLRQIYEYYQKSYKKNTWFNYLKWLKENKKEVSEETQNEFRKTKLYHKQIDTRSFCSFWLGHIPTEDLWYLLSIAKDMDNRNQNFNKWLFWSLRVNK